MELKNCLTCRHVSKRQNETGRTGWQCLPNGMDVNGRMCCEEWDTPSWELLASEGSEA